MSVYALSLGVSGIAKLDTDADRIDASIYLIQAAQYLYLGVSARLREEPERDQREKIVSILTDFITFSLFGYEYYRDNSDLSVINQGPEKNFQKVLAISYTVSNLIFILNSYVDFTNALTKEFMLTSSSSCLYCLGSMLAVIAYWTSAFVITDFLETWFKQSQQLVRGVSDFNTKPAFYNM
jgi:hypothetical protein